jgi:4-diphosphocytidyl-2-C-methyl-D-erythritol kinase
MSGSGATCFALFARDGEAQAAARTIAQEQPRWWVRAGRLV